MAKFKYGLFYDFHTPTTIPDVGAKFDVEAFTDQVKSCGVDFLTWHARCNQGNAYYNTKLGCGIRRSGSTSSANSENPAAEKESFSASISTDT